MRKLPNYLRRERKLLHLTQEEVAYLLGVKSGAKVCRYEVFSREPELPTALAFQVIFGKPVSELFAGVLERIEKDVRARILAMPAEDPYLQKILADIINRK